MAIMFSASTVGFYDTAVHRDIPLDAVQVSDAERTDLLTKQSAGLFLTLGEDGRPVAIDTPVTVSADDARFRRNSLLAASDWTQILDAPVDQVAWATYRQALRDITAQAGFPEQINWPEAP